MRTRTPLALTVVLLLCSCAGSAQDDTSTDDFVQTWDQDYATTTCREWTQDMTADQQRVAAADMLVGAQSVDGGDRLPSDTAISSFQGDITEACSADASVAITEVAVGVYVLGKDQYAP